jgi:hypothetical protein
VRFFLKETIRAFSNGKKRNSEVSFCNKINYFFFHIGSSKKTVSPPPDALQRAIFYWRLTVIALCK